MSASNYYYYKNEKLGFNGYYTTGELFIISKRHFNSTSKNVRCFNHRLWNKPTIEEAVEDYRPKSTRVCRNCGQQFRATVGVDDYYCSNECRNEAENDMEDGKCVDRGNEEWKKLNDENRSQKEINRTLNSIPAGMYDDLS